MTEGLPGLPGSPGESGEYGGGAEGRGGAGGHGGSGGKVSHRIEWAFVGLVIVLVVLVAYVIKTTHDVNRNAARIGAAEKKAQMAFAKADQALTTTENLHTQAIVRIYQTDYRLCYRGQVTRAALNLYILADPRHDTRLLPLYDCTPNLTGGVAKRLTPAQTKAFERYVLTAKNPP